MKIAITGHRPNKLGNDYDLISPLIKELEKLLHGDIISGYSPTHLISGMALGIDTLWAIMAIRYNIPLIAAIPFTNQDAVWPQKSKTIYRTLLSKAHEVINVSSQIEYEPKHMQLRNEWMVDNCDLLVAIWDGTSGGTANCIKYAEGRKAIVHYDPKRILNRIL